ncbi:hypothetical protein AWR27_15935 [Spirosoma montaniterrae]|uniref:Uncharacterized protein n=1 Tax=Spirosoma montaniterrae TaxID=1178516 RepID=A0A1P9WZ77_9BACT|nr:hypothetical protein AWR27_15935 [Spirosoma montaniterrae]
MENNYIFWGLASLVISILTFLLFRFFIKNKRKALVYWLVYTAIHYTCVGLLLWVIGPELWQ